jgi:hypothetical protein
VFLGGYGRFDAAERLIDEFDGFDLILFFIGFIFLDLE